MKKKSSTFRNITFQQSGFTLVEAMIALVIFSVGLLGLAGMQMTGIQSNHSSMMRTIATQLSYDLSERIRSNRADDYVNPAGPVAANDILAWNTMVANQLVSGVGLVAPRAGGGVIIRVFWDENRTGANQTARCPPNPNQPLDMQCVELEVAP